MQERWSKAEILALAVILAILALWLLGVFVLPYTHYSPTIR